MFSVFVEFIIAIYTIGIWIYCVRTYIINIYIYIYVCVYFYCELLHLEANFILNKIIISLLRCAARNCFVFASKQIAKKTALCCLVRWPFNLFKFKSISPSGARYRKKKCIFKFLFCLLCLSLCFAKTKSATRAS